MKQISVLELLAAHCDNADIRAAAVSECASRMRKRKEYANQILLL